ALPIRFHLTVQMRTHQPQPPVLTVCERYLTNAIGLRLKRHTAANESPYQHWNYLFISPRNYLLNFIAPHGKLLWRGLGLGGRILRLLRQEQPPETTTESRTPTT